MTALGLHQLTSLSRVCSKNSRAICFRRKRLQKLFKLVFIKYSQAYNFINKETITQMFSCECCEIFKNSFFIEHLQWLFQLFHVKTLELFAALILCSSFVKAIVLCFWVKLQGVSFQICHPKICFVVDNNRWPANVKNFQHFCVVRKKDFSLKWSQFPWCYLFLSFFAMDEFGIYMTCWGNDNIYSFF